MRAAKHRGEKGGGSNRETPRQGLPIDNVIRKESEARGGRESLHPSRQLGHQGRREGPSVMNSHGVEISIAGGVGEKVRGSNYHNPISFI